MAPNETEPKQPPRPPIEYLQDSVILPVTGWKTVFRESDGYVDRMIFESPGDVEDVLPDVFAYVVLELNGKQPTREDILDLPMPDYRTLAVKQWCISNQAKKCKLRVTTECLGCKDNPAVFDIPMDELDVVPRPADFDEESGTYQYTLLRPKWIVRFGYPTYRQEIADRGKGALEPTRLMMRWVRSIDGNSEISEKRLLELPGETREDLLREITSKRCGIDPRVRFTHHCGTAVEANIFNSPDFFLRGLAAIRSLL